MRRLFFARRAYSTHFTRCVEKNNLVIILIGTNCNCFLISNCEIKHKMTKTLIKLTLFFLKSFEIFVVMTQRLT